MPRYHVNANSLNVRSTPRVRNDNKIAVLPFGHLVEKVADADAGGWWKIRTRLQEAAIEGFVSSEFLSAEDGFTAPQAATSIRSVHLEENNPKITRASSSGRAFPLGEPAMPFRTGTSPEEKRAQLAEIVRFLDVEKNARYKPEPKATYCNIYAYDYCYLARVYLPRVWWTEGAIAQLARSEPVFPSYGHTVRELSANALYDWLSDFGDLFGWKRATSLEELQGAANQGAACVICAQRTDRNQSGHISAVVPEAPPNAARRKQNNVRLPLQSQAGRKNFCYSCGTGPWWQGTQFGRFGFWIHP